MPLLYNAFILTRSRVGLLHVIFQNLYQSYGPLFTQKFSFPSPQHFENKLTYNNQILYMVSHLQGLAWNCYVSFFPNLYQSYGPWFMPKFRFRSISWETIDRILPWFIYKFILTRSSLGLLHVIFRTFVPELWHLIYVKISFPLNISRANWQNFTKFYICIILTRSSLGLLHVFFCKLYKSYGAWFTPEFRSSSIYCELAEFHQILYMHWYC